MKGLYLGLAAHAALVQLGCARTPEQHDTPQKVEAATPKKVEAAAPDPCAVHGRINRDAVFEKACSPYLQPSGGIDIIDGATLTIEAGVEIRFNDGDWLEVGAAGKPGRLIAKGTAEDPILLTTSSPETPRTWLGVWFHSGTLPGSELSHAVVQRAGGDNRHSKPNLLMGCVTLTGVKAGALALADVHVEDCTNGGFRISKSQAEVARLSVSDTADGFVVDAASAGLLREPALQERVTRDVITGGQVTATASWVAQPVPYAVSGDIEIGGADAPILSLLPGIALAFEPGRSLQVGTTEPGGLQALGTESAPVELRASDVEKPWKGVAFGERTAAGSRLVHARVRGAGPEAAVTVRSLTGRVALEHVAFSDNASDVWVGCGSKPSLQSNAHASGKGVKRDTHCR